jgi:hypothetical protein
MSSELNYIGRERETITDSIFRRQLGDGLSHQDAVSMRSNRLNGDDVSSGI